MIFIKAGHVPCQDMVREKYYKKSLSWDVVYVWFTIRGLVQVSARQFNEKTKTIN